MDLNNLKVEDLVAKIKQLDKKTLVSISISAGFVLILILVYYIFVNPHLKRKKAAYEDMLFKEGEINQFKPEITQANISLKQLRPKFEAQSSLFHTKSEVEGLYKSISEFSILHDLKILKITKLKPEPVLKPGITNDTPGKENKKNVAYYKIMVDFEITGNFLGYIRFKKSLSRTQKMINFEKEIIEVVPKDKNGTIVAKGKLSVVGLANEF